MYIELHSRSAFSFLEGASAPEQLIATGSELQMPAMALLDRDGLYGSARFHLAAKRAGIKALIGAEVSGQEHPPEQKTYSDTDSANQSELKSSVPLCPPGASRIPLLAASRIG